MIFDGRIPGEDSPAEEPADEFVQLEGNSVMTALVHVTSVLTRRYGGQVDIPQSDMDGIGGWSLRLFYNHKTNVLRAVVDGTARDPIWDTATPGVEPGHA